MASISSRTSASRRGKLTPSGAVDQARSTRAVDAAEANDDTRDATRGDEPFAREQGLAAKLRGMRRRAFVNGLAAALPVDRRARSHHDSLGTLALIQEPLQKARQTVEVGPAIGLLVPRVRRHSVDRVFDSRWRRTEFTRLGDVSANPTNPFSKRPRLGNVSTNSEDFVPFRNQHLRQRVADIAATRDHHLCHAGSMPQIAMLLPCMRRESGFP